MQTWREYPLLAIQNLTRAIQLNPKLSDAYKQRAIALERVGNLDAAEADLKKAIDLQGESSEVMRLWAEIHRRRGDLAASILDLDRAIKLNPQETYNHSLRAESLEAKGDLKGAENSYSRAIELGDKDNTGLYHARRALIRERLGDLDGALSDYSEAIDHPGQNTFYSMEPTFRRGSILFAKGQYDAALADFRVAGDTCRDRGNGLVTIHVWLTRSLAGAKAEADVELSDHAQLNGGMVGDVENSLVQFLLGKISESQFIRQFDPLDELDLPPPSSRRDLVSFFYAGVMRLRNKDIKEAAFYFRKAAIEGPYATVPPFPDECRWAKSLLSQLGD